MSRSRIYIRGHNFGLYIVRYNNFLRTSCGSWRFSLRIRVRWRHSKWPTSYLEISRHIHSGTLNVNITIWRNCWVPVHHLYGWFILRRHCQLVIRNPIKCNQNSPMFFSSFFIITVEHQLAIFFFVNYSYLIIVYLFISTGDCLSRPYLLIHVYKCKILELYSNARGAEISRKIPSAILINVVWSVKSD